MDKEQKDKVKLEIEELKSERENLFFEVSQRISLFIGICSLLIAIFIPIIVIIGSFNNISVNFKITSEISLAVILIFLLSLSRLVISPKGYTQRIEEINQKLKCDYCKLKE